MSDRDGWLTRERVQKRALPKCDGTVVAIDAGAATKAATTAGAM